MGERDEAFQPTACILCSLNCGLEVTVEDGRIAKVRGDRAHPVSQGYLCQKARQLDHYQNNGDRLTAPLRRRADGSHEPISWDEAIREIAAKLVALRKRHGGKCFAYYGGGGQGNHFPGLYASALRAALGTPYLYSALAQEKTGDFWVNGKLFGRQTSHVTEDVEHADYVLFLGTNPWQAHGIPRARAVLREIAKDPKRTMVVIDPRRTETAELADLHLQLRPGTDAFLLGAILGVLVQENLVNRPFLERHVTGWEAVRSVFQQVPVEAFARRADVPVEDVRAAARGLAKARAASVRADLGLQQSPRSTLNSYLEKLLFLTTGNLGRPGTNSFHTFFLPLIGHSGDADDPATIKTTVTGAAEIGKLFPPNVLPAEIDTDHPGRIRALIVDSGNPLMTAADTKAYRAAFAKLELAVVIDVAMSETARHADYVLPASSQYEKYEATFFNFGFPTNTFHLRRPILPPREGTLPEPEIYRRLLVAMGELPDRFPVLEAVARIDRLGPSLRLFPMALKLMLALKPRYQKLATVILAETLGKALPNGAKAAAPLWFACQQYAARHPAAVERAGVHDQGAGLGEALFAKLLQSPAGMTLSTHEYADTWSFIRHPDGKVRLDIPELLEQLAALDRETDVGAERDEEYPFLLIAGERRSFNANTILRDPAWRQADEHGALRVHPADARDLGCADGDELICESARGELRVRALVCDSVRRGMVTLPHGYGMRYTRPKDGVAVAHGPALNEITDAAYKDPISHTPLHKHIRVRLRRAAAGVETRAEELAVSG